MKFQRFHQGEHLKSECEYRNVKCDFCGKDVAFASMKEHVDTICDGAPVTCKYCNKKDILRTDIERHERRDCEEVPATCEFQAVGCNHAKILRSTQRNSYSKLVKVHSTAEWDSRWQRFAKTIGYLACDS
ncbi:TNF receptor-associated factor 3-like [Paramuricea clavata]|uniref:TNF receptor-associated factor 3-like n=1 Tax=Paramuricea clavata TaxID=317549 RepID=A0A6S7J7F0_PARCT|nr:TNF receptor-associated factor 3-like [Paramuricea clavata]